MRTSVNSAAVRAVVRAFADRMAQARSDELIPHNELRRLIPRELQERPYYAFVADARKLVNKELGIVFATVKKEGYRRLTGDVGVEYAGTKPMHQIRRLARRSKQVLANAVHFANDLTPSQRRAAFQSSQVYGLVEHLTNRRTINTMPDEPDPNRPVPDPLDGLRQILGR